MATATLVPSAYTLSNTNYLSITDASNMYTDTSSSTYAQITHNRSSNTAYYLYIHGFNFNSIPNNAVVSSFTVKIKALESQLSTNASYRISLYNNTTSIPDTTVSTALSTSAQTLTIPIGSLDWATMKNYGNNFRIRVPLRRANSNTSGYVRVYGAEIDVTYTAETVHVTGVTLNKSSTSIEIGSTEQLTATVAPSNATDQTVSWSSGTPAVATVDSSGVVTAVSTGTSVITVTTTDGGYTDTCTVTVTQPTYTTYELTTTLTPGESYLIVSGNSGSVYLLSNEANGAGTLKGVSATVVNGEISITHSVENKCLFDCVLEDNNNSDSQLLMSGSDYLYTDSSNRLRIASWTSSMAGKHWHYKADNKNLIWFFKDNNGDTGYTDTSSTYKYYFNIDGSGNWTDLYVSTTSLENTNTPEVFLFKEKQTPSQTAYIKVSGSWVQASKVYKKVSGSWVEQNDLTQVFDAGTNYKKA